MPTGLKYDSMTLMKTLSRSHWILRKHALLIAGLFLTVYFSYHIVYGARSFTQLRALEAEVALRDQELFEVRSDREMQESKVRMMRPGSLSRDLLEERARVVLGYKRADEFLLLGN